MESLPASLRVLETVLYYAPGEQEAVRRFYGDVLGLRQINLSERMVGFRAGGGVILLFDRDQSQIQESPPKHSGSGPLHTCFVVPPGGYEAWKERLSEHGVPVVDEIEWDEDLRSFYFEDPAGNVLEIASGDMWPA